MDDSGVKESFLSFTERMLNLIDQGGFTATYKFAVLLGLIDLCIQCSEKDGKPPSSVTTIQLAERVVELYWPQTLEFKVQSKNDVLRQNTNGQAEIVRDISRFRSKLADQSIPLASARYSNRTEFGKLIRSIERKLIEMPLPRLQKVGGNEERFIYEIGWDEGIKLCQVNDYQRGRPFAFDNRINFKPEAAENLIILNSMIRPLIHRKWASMVSKINDLSESKLDDFLFGTDRVSLERIRPSLQEIQENRCFYCGSRIQRRPVIDHFIPRARYPDDGIENLVATDEKCNRDKRDFLASAEHVSRWAGRNRAGSASARRLIEIAEKEKWGTHPEETLGIARTFYLRLPDTVKLWEKGNIFVPVNTEELKAALRKE